MSDALMSGTDERKAIMKLLRFMGAGTATLVPCGREVGIVRLTDQMKRLFSESLVRKAASGGLVRISGNGICVAPEAQTWLRRAMLAGCDDAFAEQHRAAGPVEVDVAGERHLARRNSLSSPLLSLARMKERDGQPWFPQEALDAGERLHGDFHRGQINPQITSRWEPRLAQRGGGSGGGMAAMNDLALSARDRFNDAAGAMGPELSGVAIDICCFEKGLETVERERQWPVRSAKLMLRTALMVLARHYAPPATASRQSHRWSAG